MPHNNATRYSSRSSDWQPFSFSRHQLTQEVNIKPTCLNQLFPPSHCVLVSTTEVSHRALEILFYILHCGFSIGSLSMSLSQHDACRRRLRRCTRSNLQGLGPHSRSKNQGQKCLRVKLHDHRTKQKIMPQAIEMVPHKHNLNS